MVLKKGRCNASCVTEYSRGKDHLKNHMDANHFSGEIKHSFQCNYSSRNKSTLNRHVQLCHKNKQTQSSDVNPVSPQKEDHRPMPFKCPVCDSKFHWKKNLNHHLKMRHFYVVPNKSHLFKKNCPLCSFKASDKSHEKLKNQMYNHFKNHHNSQLEIETLNFQVILSSLLGKLIWKQKLWEKIIEDNGIIKN